MAVNFRTLTIKQIEQEVAEKVTSTIPDLSAVPIHELQETLHRVVGQLGSDLAVRPTLKCNLECDLFPPECTLSCSITFTF